MQESDEGNAEDAKRRLQLRSAEHRYYRYYH